MNRFTFSRPASIEEVLLELNKLNEKTVILNGGTDVMVSMYKNNISNCSLIYIHDLPELKIIEQQESSLILGGAVTYRQLEDSNYLKMFPGIAQTLSELASPPIRNMATPAGNLAASSPAGDFNIILLALDGKVELTSVYEKRLLKLKDFFISANKNALRSNELITKIIIPMPKKNQYSSFVKIARRKAQDISCVAVAV